MIFFICYFSFGSSAVYEVTSWKRILFSENNLIGKELIRTIELKRKIYCGTSCLSTENCKFWCFKSDGYCYLYNFAVSPVYETTGVDLIDCYTKKRNDIVSQASIVSIGAFRAIDVIENLKDGIAEGRFCTTYNSEPWILIDLKNRAQINNVGIQAVNDAPLGPMYCQYIEVRISSTPPVTPGDFSSWDLFYYLDRKCVVGVVENLKSSSPKIGQYISLLRKTIGHFCINHLEIDGVFIN